MMGVVILVAANINLRQVPTTVPYYGSQLYNINVYVCCRFLFFTAPILYNI